MKSRVHKIISIIGFLALIATQYTNCSGGDQYMPLVTKNNTASSTACAPGDEACVAKLADENLLRLDIGGSDKYFDVVIPFKRVAEKCIKNLTPVAHQGPILPKHDPVNTDIWKGDTVNATLGDRVKLYGCITPPVGQTADQFEFVNYRNFYVIDKTVRKIGQDFVEISGTCFTSKFPDNKIMWRLDLMKSGVGIPLKETSSEIAEVAGTTPLSGETKCVNGKYSFKVYIPIIENIQKMQLNNEQKGTRIGHDFNLAKLLNINENDGVVTLNSTHSPIFSGTDCSFPGDGKENIWAKCGTPAGAYAEISGGVIDPEHTSTIEDARSRVNLFKGQVNLKRCSLSGEFKDTTNEYILHSDQAAVIMRDYISKAAMTTYKLSIDFRAYDRVATDLERREYYAPKQDILIKGRYALKNSLTLGAGNNPLNNLCEYDTGTGNSN